MLISIIKKISMIVMLVLLLGSFSIGSVTAAVFDDLEIEASASLDVYSRYVLY